MDLHKVSATILATEVKGSALSDTKDSRSVRRWYCKLQDQIIGPLSDHDREKRGGSPFLRAGRLPVLAGKWGRGVGICDLRKWI
jgi:hypothetical protein